MSLCDELRDAKQSAKTHEAICQSLIKENIIFREALEKIIHNCGSGSESSCIARKALTIGVAK